MAHLLRHLIFAAAAFAAFSPAFAQTPANKDVSRTFRFYYIDFSNAGDPDGNTETRFMIENGRADLAVELSANAFSPSVSYAGPVPASLFREKRTEKGVEREDLGQLQFPAEWKGAIFLATRDPSKTLPFAFHPIEYWGPSVPDGHVRVVNLCPYPMAAKIGDAQSALAGRETRDLPMPSDRPDVPLRLAVNRTDKWERILSTAILRPAQGKLILLAFPRPDGGTRVLVVQDLPQPPEPAAAP